MVGVPGRSKGCNTCIQRKVKCDGGQPACGNCRKSQRLCTGYKRAVAFVMSSDVDLASGPPVEDTEGVSVTAQGRWRRQPRKPAARRARGEADETTPRGASTRFTPAGVHSVDATTTAWDWDPGSRPTHSRAKSSSRSSSSSSPEHDSQALVLASTRRRRPQHGMDPESRAARAFRGSPTVAGAPWPGPEALSAASPAASPAAAFVGSPLAVHVATEAAWREQLYPLFLSFHLPADVFANCGAPARSRLSRNWLVNLTLAPLQGSPVLETAMAALCMARVGRRHANAALVQHSLRLYTQGLRELHDAIHDPVARLADQTLAASLAFSLYEVAECPAEGLRGYTSHHEGGLTLLQLRGAGAHTTPLARSLLVFMRMQQFVYALLTRKAGFLCRPEWMTRPWLHVAKDPQDRFMDQMYCIPVLLERTDTLVASGADGAARIHGFREIIAQYDAIYVCLQGWLRDLQASVPGPLFWPELATIEVPGFGAAAPRGRLYPVSFFFPAFAVGNSMVLFWLIALIVKFQVALLYLRIVRLRQGTSTPDVTAAIPVVRDDDIAAAPSSATAASQSPPEDPEDMPLFTPPAGPLPDVASIPSMVERARQANVVAHELARNICQSVEFFLQDRMCDLGPLSMMLPLTALRHMLAHMPPLQRCRPGPVPERPGEYSDPVVWVDSVIHSLGGRGQKLALYMEDDDD